MCFSHQIEECSHYDVPRAPMPVQRIGMYDCPRPLVDWYDAPRAPRPASADSACSGTGSLASATSSASANSGSSVHSAASASSTYDVPRSRALPLPCDAALEALDRLQVGRHFNAVFLVYSSIQKQVLSISCV